MATREELITRLEHEIGRVQHARDVAMTTEEQDWMRSARLAVERLQSAASTEDDEGLAQQLLARVRDGGPRDVADTSVDFHNG